MAATVALTAAAAAATAEAAAATTAAAAATTAATFATAGSPTVMDEEDIRCADVMGCGAEQGKSAWGKELGQWLVGNGTVDFQHGSRSE
jgi:hypothetical protein